MTDSPGRPADEPRKVPTPPRTTADDAETPDPADSPEPDAAPAPDAGSGAAPPEAPATPWTATDAPRLDALRAGSANETTSAAPAGDASPDAAATAPHDAEGPDSTADASGTSASDASASSDTAAQPTASQPPAAASAAAGEASAADASGSTGATAPTGSTPASPAPPTDAATDGSPSEAHPRAGAMADSAMPDAAPGSSSDTGAADTDAASSAKPTGAPSDGDASDAPSLGTTAVAPRGSDASPDAPAPGTPPSDSPRSATTPAAVDPAAEPSSDSPVPHGWSPHQPPASPGWGAPGGSGNGVPPGWGVPHQPQQPRPPQAPGWGAPGGPPGPPPAHGWGAPGGPAWGPPPRWQGSATPAAKPGIIPLRPLGVGEVLDGAIAAMRAHWKIMIGLSLVMALVTQAIAVPAQWAILRNVDTSVFEEAHPDADRLKDALGPVLGSSVLVFAIMLLGQLFVTGILTLVVSRAVLGKDITLARAWQGAKPLLWRLLGVSALTPLIPAGLFLACLLPGIVLTVLFGTAGSAVLVLGLIGGGVLFAYSYVLLALATPALILEKQTVGKALARSRKLVTGNWWRICGMLLLIMILSLLIGGVVQAPFTLATGFSEFGKAVPDSFTDAMIVGIGGVLSYAITFPFNAGATALLYIDQRMRREALDLELARAAGLVADDATPAAS